MAHTYLATWQSEGLYLALPCRVGERRASVRQRDAKQFLQAEPASRPRASTIEFHLPKAAKRPGLTQALGRMKNLVFLAALLLAACSQQAPKSFDRRVASAEALEKTSSGL